MEAMAPNLITTVKLLTVYILGCTFVNLLVFCTVLLDYWLL